LAAGHTAMGMEDPGSYRLVQAARMAGLELVGLPVDDDGLVVDELEKRPGLRAVCVGAARQIATGCTLGPRRRGAPVNWERPGGGGWTGWSGRTTRTPSSATAGPRCR